MNHIFEWIFSQYKDTPTHLLVIELLGVFFGLVSVLFSKKRNIWVYPTGIISTVLFVYLLWIGRLFGDMLINAYYTVMSVYVMLVYYFKPYINNDFSMEGTELGLKYFVWTDWVDASTTAIFLVGMWLMARRKIENWLFWIIGDAISIPLYTYKGFLFTALQYAIFTLIAILAYIEWKKILYSNRASANASLS